jgi:hypothetical protein
MTPRENSKPLLLASFASEPPQKKKSKVGYVIEVCATASFFSFKQKRTTNALHLKLLNF